MPKRLDSLETLRHALQLLVSIPKQGSITATNLRQKLDDEDHIREPRTIQRLLETLYDFDLLGIARDLGSNPYGSWRKEKASCLSIPGLTTQEPLLLTLAQQQLSTCCPTG